LKQVLLLTDINFWIKGAGHRMRIDSLVRYLATKVDLTIVFIGAVSPETGMAVAGKYRLRFIILEPEVVIAPEEYGRRLSTFLADNFFDSIIIEYIHNTNFIDFLVYECQLILDIHDIASERSAEFEKFGYSGHVMDIDRTAELEILDIYDHVLVLCENDLRLLSKHLGKEKPVLCGYAPELAPRPLRGEVMNICFVGSEYLPNLEAIQHFLSHCWPVLREKFGISLRIYGNVCKSLNYQLPVGAYPMGYIENIDSVYDDSDIIINPVRFGAGLKIKSMEALACGLPLVVTPHAARGLEEFADEAFMVAGSDDAFIDLLSRLITEPVARRALSTNALRVIDRYFRPETCYRPLLDVLSAAQ
jgi:glycosyltransferase involved in cell wall biosynthesis